MKKSRINPVLVLTIVVSLAMTACGGKSGDDLGVDTPLGIQPIEIPDQEVKPVAIESSSTQVTQGVSNLDSWVEEVPKSDEQGAVSVVITPLNLNSAWGTIDFQVNLNTHSVDLSMDLAVLSTLTTDTGHSVQATLWDAPRGSHHVSGNLSFPAIVDGNQVLDGAERITLILEGVDSPERVFVWER